ncbi:DUF6348 family protein [Symmachiella dynata]|nr:DUF6348 family protein [Symmachiella dynata]
MILLATLTGCSESPPSMPGPSNAASQPTADVRGDSTINPLLVKLLRDHGLDATSRDGWILVDNRPSICGAIVREMQPSSNVTSIQIDVYLRVDPDRILMESFAGIGLTKDEAITDGIQNFVANSFHVLLAAFYRDGDDDQVETEQWDINGQSRRVTIGNMGIRGTVPNPDEPPTAWFKALESQIKASSLPPGTHWVRCYYSQMQNQPTALEVLLDNGDWGAVRSEMLQVNWPQGEDFYSVRVFLVVQDSEG